MADINQNPKSYFGYGRCSSCSHYKLVKSCSFYAIGDYKSVFAKICEECIDKVKNTVFKDQ